VAAATGMVLGLYYSVLFTLKLNVMALDRSIGSTGLEQGGPNLGNDYSRDITREQQSDDTLKVIVPKDKKKDAENENQQERERREKHNSY
jgi:hypothetical protein